MTEDVLLPYQKAWIQDEATVKVWEKSRRIGASYVEALASVREAAKPKEAAGKSSYYLSYSKEMTQQFARDCAFWAKHINLENLRLSKLLIWPTLARCYAHRRCPPGGLMSLGGSGSKKAKRPLLRAFAALEPSPQYR